MVKIVFYFLTLVFSLSAFSLEKVTASIDKNPAIKGESIVLEVIADDSVNANAFDSSALLNDFVVGRTSTNSQTQIINGRTSKQTKWVTVLLPKRTGKIVIPSFTIEGKSSAPIALVVTEASEQQKKQRDIYLEAEISNTEIFVQQHATLTVKLFIGVSLEGGSLSEPTMDDAIISQLGEDSQVEQIINGRRFQVIERKFAVSPQKSGEFSLDMPIFSGQVAEQSQRRSGLFNFRQSKPVSVISDPIQITVKPRPADYRGHWLPSELFSLHEEWQPNADEFIAGEPITRTITMTAVGITKEQLPKLDMPATQGLKVYPEQPALHSGVNSKRLVSQAVTNFAIVPSSAGEFVLPEIRIPWFNTVTKRQEYATLPARKITVKANPELVNTQPVQAQSNDISNAAQPSQQTTIIVNETSWLQWLFLALWLVSLILWFFHVRYLKQGVAHSSKSDIINSDNPYLSLLAACKQHQGQEALSLLLAWFKILKPAQNITSISDGLNEINDQALTAAVNELQACYFGKTPQQWHGQNLLTAINTVHKNQTRISEKVSFDINP